MTKSQIFLDSFEGKVVVLTGGSRGIGKAIADELVANKAKVVIGDVMEKEGQDVVDSYNKNAGSKVAAFLYTDVTKYKDNQDLFKLAESEFGGVDYAVLNAGIATNADSTFSRMDDDFEEKIIDVNTTAVIKGTKVAILHISKRGGGGILHVASVAGFSDLPTIASYNASKHAVIGYTRSFSLLPRICNIRVNAICPFYVDTDMITIDNNGDKISELSPYQKFISSFRHTPINVVVEGALQLMADEANNTETWLSLPDGNVPMKRPTLPGSLTTEKSRDNLKGYFDDFIIPRSKAALEEALKRYNI